MSSISPLEIFEHYIEDLALQPCIQLLAETFFRRWLAETSSDDTIELSGIILFCIRTASKGICGICLPEEQCTCVQKFYEDFELLPPD